MLDNRHWWSDVPVGPGGVVLVFAALVVLGMLQAGGHIPCHYGGAELASTRITTNNSWRYAQKWPFVGVVRLAASIGAA